METSQRLRFEGDLSLILGIGTDRARMTAQSWDKAALKRAYYRRAQCIHPDKAGILGIPADVLSTEFRALAEAYSRVMDDWESTSQNRGVSPWGDHDYSRQTKDFTNARIRITRVQRLRFADYLYKKGVIDWRTLIDALSWQYRSRPKIGEIAMRKGYLGHSDVLDIIRRRRVGEAFGSAALRLGYLDPKSISILLGHQGLMGLPIGLYFTRMGLLSKERLSRYLKDFHAYNLGATEVR